MNELLSNEQTKPTYSSILDFGPVYMDDLDQICRLYEDKNLTPILEIYDYKVVEYAVIYTDDKKVYPPRGADKIQAFLTFFAGHIRYSLSDFLVYWKLNENKDPSLFNQDEILAIKYSKGTIYILSFLETETRHREPFHRHIGALTKERLRALRRSVIYRWWSNIVYLVVPIITLSVILNLLSVDNIWFKLFFILFVLFIGSAFVRRDKKLKLHKSTEDPLHLRRTSKIRLVELILSTVVAAIAGVLISKLIGF